MASNTLLLFLLLCVHGNNVFTPLALLLQNCLTVKNWLGMVWSFRRPAPKLWKAEAVVESYILLCYYLYSVVFYNVPS